MLTVTIDGRTYVDNVTTIKKNLVGYPCVAMAYNNTHINYPKKLNIFY
jgi:hypothetical protein